MAQAELQDLPIEWVGDSTRNVQIAASAIDYADWLSAQDVAVVVGHSGSRGSVAAGTIYAQHGIVQVAPLATARELTAGNRRAFGLVPNDSIEGAYIAAFADSALHSRRVALLYHQDEFGIGIRDGVVAELGRRGRAIVDERFFAPEGAQGPSVDVGTLLAAALRSRPDVIVLGARIAQTRDVARYLRAHGLRIPVVCSDGSYVLPPGSSARDLSDLEGFYIVRFWSPERDSAGAAFARTFEQRYGYVPDQSEALTYDAVKLVGLAVKDGARTSDEFARALTSYGRAKPGHPGLVTAEYSFTNGRPRNMVPDIGLVRGGVLKSLAARSSR
jgi:branched-chain amino acid transport system substrate-binding protein